MNKKQSKEDIRINKFIAHNTNYSRREAEQLILSQRVKIGTKIVMGLGTVVSEDETVYIDSKPIQRKKDNEYTVIVYNKSKGELVTKSDPMHRKTIYDALPSGFKHFLSIGRLDFASEGVLLLTDSPKVATALANSNLERMYKIKIKGLISEAVKNAMQSGLEIVGSKKGAHEKTKIENITFAPFCRFLILKESPTYSKLKIVIAEGLNREVRRFFAHFDREVTDLKRIEFGGISLNNLPSGKWRFLTKSEYKSLHTYLKLENKKSQEC